MGLRCAIIGSGNTGTDLMKYSKWTERVWRGGAGNFRVQ